MKCIYVIIPAHGLANPHPHYLGRWESWGFVKVTWAIRGKQWVSWDQTQVFWLLAHHLYFVVSICWLFLCVLRGQELTVIQYQLYIVNALLALNFYQTPATINTIIYWILTLCQVLFVVGTLHVFAQGTQPSRYTESGIQPLTKPWNGTTSAPL